MKALFIRTSTNDVDNHVQAWDSFNECSEKIVFDYRSKIDNEGIKREAKEISPEVIFYIGGCLSEWSPKISTFIALRKVAPVIHFCCDGGGNPWPALLEIYANEGCFDLQITIDGSEAPVDLITLTPVDLRFFEEPDPPREIKCGFSGAYASGPRANFLARLEVEGLVKLRRRVPRGGYQNHVNFLRSCYMTINTSFCGSGTGHHVKGRVLEAGFAGCALLEYVDSPTSNWIPEEYFYSYTSLKDVKRLIKTLTVEEMLKKGAALRTFVKANYTPQQIYGEMLQRINL